MIIDSNERTESPPKSSNKNRFFKNVSWLLFEKVFQMAIQLVVGILTARYLGPSNYGVLNYSASLIALFTPFCTLGLEGIIISRMKQNSEDTELIVGSGIFLRAVSSAFSIVLILGLVAYLQPNNNLLLMVALLQSLSLLFKSLEIIDYWFQSNLNSKYTVIAKTIATALVAGWKISLLIFKAPVALFALSISIEAVILACILGFFYFKKDSRVFKYSVDMGKSLLSESYHFIISGMFVVVYTQLNKVMIGQIEGQYSVGIFSASMMIVELWYFVPMALMNSARPIIMETKGHNEHTYIKRLKQMYAIIIWMGIGYSIFITIFGAYAISILYGKDYLSAVTPLLIGVWSGTFALLGVARGTWLVCEKKAKYAVYCIAGGSVVNLTLNLWLIPSIGINGAAISIVVSQIIGAVIMPLFFKDIRMFSVHVLQALLLKGVR